MLDQASYLFSTRTSHELAEKIAQSYGQPLGKINIQHFSDGEFEPVLEQSVRGARVFLIASTFPPADNLLELLLMIDAAKRASAKNITVVIPYYGLARQDRKDKPRAPIGAKLVANLLTAAGATRIMTMDLHADQIQGFFDIPVDNIYATPVLLNDLEKQDYDNIMVVSPDVGGVVRARAMAKQLGDADLAIIDKRRARANESQVMNIIGDVRDRDCVIVDDMVDTAGTLCKAAQALKDSGARRVLAYITHPVLSGNALKNISDSALDEIVVTDTIPLSSEAAACSKIRQISIAPMLAESLRRINNEESISAMFDA